MSSVDSFLGSIAGAVVSRLVSAGHSGVRLQNTTPFALDSFLTNIVTNPRPRIALAGAKIGELARKTKYPVALLTAGLAEATQWRNDPSITEGVVIVAPGEEERLGSFHRFTEVKDRDLYDAICILAQDELSPNEVQREWWSVLARPEIRRQISVFRLASYFAYLNDRTSDIPDASRNGLSLLGLLPSRGFFEHPSPSQLLRNYHANRQLINRIEILSNADRDRLTRGLDAATGADRERLQATLGKVLKYNRSGSHADRAVLLAEDVRALFEAKKTKTKPKAHNVVPIERAGVDALLHGDERDLSQLGLRLRERISNLDEDDTPTVAVDVDGRSEQAAIRIPPSVVRVLTRSVTTDILGGIFHCASKASFDEVLSEIEQATFTAFSVEGDASAQTLLRRVVGAKLIEPEILDRWYLLLKLRSQLVPHAAAIAVSPIVALASDKSVLGAADSYLRAYEDLMGAMRDRYEAIASQSPKGARHLCAQLLVLDVILFQAPSGARALLSPLHPLQLWKYVRLAQQLSRERDSLSDEQKELLGASAEKLPHFVTALFVPEGLVAGQPLVLPQTYELATLPGYQEDSPHFAGSEGQDKFLRILRKFLVLYPHAKRNLRVCLIDPPDLAGLMEDIAGQIANEDLLLDGMHVTVFRTLERPVSLGSDDQQLETIASIFGSEDLPVFVLNVLQEKSTYADVLTKLHQNPTHLLAIFDPSRSEIGQFVSREAGFVHPLVLPKEFQYDPIEDRLVITPAATGDLFDVFYSLQNRLNNALSGSHFGISSGLGAQFPPTGEFLKCCTWIVLGDKLLDSIPINGGRMISFEPGVRRDIMVLTESLTKFERAFDHYLRKANLDPSEDALRELIGSSAELIGEGLLGLIRADKGDEY